MLIYKKIPLVMKDIGAVGKGGTNKLQNYKFRGIEQMYAAVHPAFIEHGVFVVPNVLETKTETFTSNKGTITHRVLLTVAHTFYAEDGSSVVVTTIGEAMDTSDKACNKAMSAAMKYALVEIFCVPTEDLDDSDSHSPVMSNEDDVPDFKPSVSKPVTKKEGSKRNEL